MFITWVRLKNFQVYGRAAKTAKFLWELQKAFDLNKGASYHTFPN